MGIFDGLLGFVVEEASVGAIIFTTYKIFTNAINSALSFGFTSVALIIFLIFIVLIVLVAILLNDD